MKQSDFPTKSPTILQYYHIFASFKTPDLSEVGGRHHGCGQGKSKSVYKIYDLFIILLSGYDINLRGLFFRTELQETDAEIGHR